MNPSEVKRELKNIQKCLQDKDYENALALCQNILISSPENYNALVFKGLALQEKGNLKDAVLCFEEAIKKDSKQILAWKGLKSFYEKNQTDENSLHLVKVYRKLTKLLGDSGNTAEQLDVITKLVLLSKAIGDSNEVFPSLLLAADTYKSLGDIWSEYCTWRSLIEFILSLEKPVDHREILENAFDAVLHCSEESRVSQSDICKLKEEQVNFLKDVDFKSAYEKAIGYAPQNAFTLKLICQLFCEGTLTTDHISQHLLLPEIEDAALNLKKISPEKLEENAISNLTLGVLQLERAEYLKALPLIVKALNAFPKLVECWVFLAKCHLGLHNMKEAEEMSVTALNVLSKCPQNKSNKDFCSVLTANACSSLSQALIGLRDFEKAKNAITKCRSIIEKSNKNTAKNYEKIQNELLECEARIAIKNCQFDTAMKITEQLALKDKGKSFLLQGMVEFEKKSFEAAEQCFLVSLKASQSTEGLSLLAITRWKLCRNKSEALDNLLQAIKADPFRAQNYVFVGHFYEDQLKFSRAEKCYMKALELNPYDEEICATISNFLLQAGNRQNNPEKTHLYVLETITQRMPKLQWGWLRLGVCYLQMKPNRLTDAIIALQKATSLNEFDSQSWECLGDAYFLQGSYGSALKAFNKVVSLKKDDIYSTYQVGKIKQVLGYYQDALIEFEKILQLDSTYIIALKGSLECYLSLAKTYITQSLTGLAESFCEKALLILVDCAFPVYKNFSFLYKLAGDFCLTVCDLGPKHFPFKLNCKLLGTAKQSGFYNLDDLATSANCYYGQAVSLNSSCSFLWHDLGISYFKISEIFSIKTSPESQIFCARSASKSIACLKHALDLSPLEPDHWACLGVIAAKWNSDQNSTLAQHCFIKSIQLEPSNVLAWTNLGALYLKSKLFELSNEAFKMAQAVDPAHPSAWTGQALLAEHFQDPDTLDLFGHSVVLGNTPEGAKGLGYWLLSALLSSRSENSETDHFDSLYEKHRLVSATDALLQLEVSSNLCASALSHLGLLLERAGTLNIAVDVSKKALDKLSCNVSPGYQNSARINLGRLLRKTGSFQESIKVMLGAEEKQDLLLLCELALSYFQNGEHEKSYQAYEMCVQLTNSMKNSPIQAHLLTAQAFVARKMPNISQGIPKTLLFKSATCKPPSIPGLLSLCALGFLSDDAKLTGAALSELEKFKLNHRFWPEIANLLALRQASLGNMESAVRQMSRAVHLQPYSAVLWSRLATFLLLSDLKNAHKAAHCSKIAFINQQRSGIKEEVLLNHQLISATSLLASGHVSDSKSLAVHSVHRNPVDIKNWACLMASLLPKSTNKNALPLVHRVIEKQSLLCKDDESSSMALLKEWLLASKILSMLQSSEPDYYQIQTQLKEQNLTLSENGPVSVVKTIYNSLTQTTFDQKIKSLKHSFSETPSIKSQSFLWMTLVKAQLIQKNYENVETDLRSWLRLIGTGDSTETPVLPLLLLLMTSIEAAAENPDSAEHWLVLGQEALDQCAKYDCSPRAIQFLSALLALQKGTKVDISFAKRVFERCLYDQTGIETPYMNGFISKLLLRIYSAINCNKENVLKLLEHSGQYQDEEMSDLIFDMGGLEKNVIK